MVKVTVIIPIYNIEQYISRCLDSVLSQSLREIEVICINDGSTDDSLRIIKQYQKLDKRIRVIDKGNGGLSSARNAGVNIARGKYILFVDGDDKISSVACERLHNFAEELESDVVIYEYIVDDIKNNVKNRVSASYLRDSFQDKTFSIETFEPSGFSNIVETAWSKLYRTDLIKDIQFCEDIIFEDVPFWAQVYTKARRISYLPEALYYYYFNRNGSIMQIADEKHFDILKAVERREEAFTSLNKYKRTIEMLSLRDILRTLGLLRADLKETFFNKIKEFNKQIDYEFYEGCKLSEFERNNLEVYKSIQELDYATFNKRYSVVSYG